MDEDFSVASHAESPLASYEDHAAPDGGLAAQCSPQLAALYMDYAEQLSATLRKMYGDGPPDPDDVTQEAFHKVMERGDIGAIANLKAFVWRTARNIVLTAKRSDAVRSRYDFEIEQLYFSLKGDSLSPERIIEVREQLKAINEVLRHMPQRRRMAVYLHRVEGLSVSETARRMGVSRKTAIKHLAQGIADLNLIFLAEGEGLL